MGGDVCPGRPGHGLVTGARRLDEVGLAPALVERLSLRLSPGADRRDGSFCTPSRRRAPGRRRAATGRTISESTESSEIWRPSPRSRSHSASGLCSASHSTPPALGSAGEPSLSPRRRQRLHRRTKTTVACGSTRAAQRRARAIPTVSCRSRHLLTPVRDRADACATPISQNNGCRHVESTAGSA